MSASAKADLTLRALGGKPAPERLGADLERLGSFAPEALREFWNALGPSLEEPITAEAEYALDTYAKRHALDDAALAKVISAARFLIREASRQKLSTPDLEADIRGLVGDRKEIVHTLTSGYRVGLAILTRGYAARSVAAHGGILKQIDWRLERIVASSEARVLDVPVARMTLTTDGPEGVKSVSLQLDLPTVLKLREACDGILEHGARATASKRTK